MAFKALIVKRYGNRLCGQHMAYYERNSAVFFFGCQCQKISLLTMRNVQNFKNVIKYDINFSE